MRIVTLIENTAAREDLTAEHGLSLYIETENHRILFDAGQSDAFAANAEKLGIDLKKVDFAILSHGHYDHGGGLRRFLELNPSAPVYLSRHAFEAHYNASGKYIGLDTGLKASERLVFVEKNFQIAEGIALHSTIPCAYSIEPYGLEMEQGSGRCPDDFCHELYLLIEEKGHIICISGCSHCGIMNIVSYFKPDVLIGGFHFKALNPDSEALAEAGRILGTFSTTYYTGHCTGEAQTAALKRILGTKLYSLTTGFELEIMKAFVEK